MLNVSKCGCSIARCLVLDHRRRSAASPHRHGMILADQERESRRDLLSRKKKRARGGAAKSGLAASLSVLTLAWSRERVALLRRERFARSHEPSSRGAAPCEITKRSQIMPLLPKFSCPVPLPVREGARGLGLLIRRH